MCRYWTYSSSMMSLNGLTSTLLITLTFHFRNSFLRKNFFVEFRVLKEHWISHRKCIKAIWLASRNKYFTFTFPRRSGDKIELDPHFLHFHFTAPNSNFLSQQICLRTLQFHSNDGGVPNRWRSHQHVARCTNDTTVPKAKISTTNPKSPLRFGMIGRAANR